MPNPVSATESRLTRQLQQLIMSLVSMAKTSHSVYQQASQYFTFEAATKQQLRQLEQEWQDSQQALSAATAATEQKLIARVRARRQTFLHAHQQIEQKRLQRLHHLRAICEQLLQLSEGQTAAETITRSSRVLGCLQLMAPTQGEQIALGQQKFKPFYRAILSLRLLDRLLEQGLITNSYILKKAKYRIANPKEQACPFQNDVQMPLLMAVLLQDVGHYHPEAQQVLSGYPAQLSRSRELDMQEREDFLHISQQASLHFLLRGIGPDTYRGHSKTERTAFEQNERDKLAFSATLLRNANEPGRGIGNLIKIPQVYASAVLPGRLRFEYEALPKVALILKNAAKQGRFNARMADELLVITGLFPQGYGIVFLPKSAAGQAPDKYEFAIVNSLYPPQPETPLCRQVTRNLQFKASGQDILVSVDHNLYFKPARQQLAVISQTRLSEILSKLTSVVEPAKLRHQLPRFWHPDAFFSDPKQQNLWNKVELIHN